MTYGELKWNICWMIIVQQGTKKMNHWVFKSKFTNQKD